MRTGALAAAVAILASIAGAAAADEASWDGARWDDAGPDQAAAGDKDDLQAKLQNPISSVVSVPFQDNVGFGIDPDHRDNNVLLVQPVAPIPLLPKWNWIVRPIIPIVSEPAPGVPGRFNGLGDIEIETFFSPSGPQKLIWGLGPNVVFPSGTNGLSQRQWGVGPSFVALVQPKPWTIGVLVAQTWGVGERPAGLPYLSSLALQPFAAYALQNGWTFSYSSPWSADWSAPGQRWTIPVGAQASKLIRPPGLFPMQFTLGAYDNVVRSEGQPAWFLRFQAQLVLPSLGTRPWFGGK